MMRPMVVTTPSSRFQPKSGIQAAGMIADHGLWVARFRGWLLGTVIANLLIFALGEVPAAAIAIEAPETLTLRGWPTAIGSPQRSPSMEVGTDAFWGTLVCPPLTRLNLRARKSEGQLAQVVIDSDRQWTFTLSQGVRWWSREAVDSRALEKYLSQIIPEISSRSAGVWKVPKFALSAEAQGRVTVRWEETPPFGPYVLNGLPLWRQTSGNPSFECAGPYRLTADGKTLLAVPDEGGKLRRPGRIALLRPKDSLPKKGSFLDLRSSDGFTADPRVRASDQPLKCRTKVPLPLVTLISWNTESKPTSSASLRHVLTQLTPRGELLRAGAGYLGDLLSGPVLRAHPGYNRSVLVRSFSLTKGLKRLEGMGYRRGSTDSPVLTPAGEPMQITLLAANEVGLPQKVLADAYAAVGIRVDVVGSKEADRPVDGVLSSFRFSWPETDLLPLFHSKSPASYPFWKFSDARLDRHLEAYSRSLSQEKPDFKWLRKIHRRLYELEPFTILVQHSACLEGSKVPTSVDVTDPGWLYSLISR